MFSSELELGEDSNGIVELPENAMIGQQTFAEHAGLNDITIENTTPNRRRDCAVFIDLQEILHQLVGN